MLSIFIAFFFQWSTPAFPSIQTPTPIPTYTPIPIAEEETYNVDELGGFVSTLEANIDELPTDLTRDQNNLSVLPDDTRYTALFSYAKWLLSPNSINEVFGAFSGFGFVFLAMVTLAVLAISIFTLVYTVVILWRGLLWATDIILRIIPGL